MFIMISICVAYKTYETMSKVKVTLRSHNSKTCKFCLVRVITSKFIVTFSNNLVKIFIIMSRCVEYKIHDSMSKVRSHLEVKG